MFTDVNNKIWYSSSDLADFAECPHKITLKLENLSSSNNTPLTRNSKSGLPQQDTNREQQYLKELEDSYIVEKISNQGSYEDRYNETISRMHDLYQPYAIYQGVLMDDTFIGLTDFLVAEGPFWDEFSEVKPHCKYQVVDIQRTNQTKERHLINLCLYSDLLSEIEGHGEPEYAHIILSNGDKESYFLDEYLDDYAVLRNRFKDFIKKPAKTSPEKCSYCDTCDFQYYCATEQFKS